MPMIVTKYARYYEIHQLHICGTLSFCVFPAVSATMEMSKYGVPLPTKRPPSKRDTQLSSHGVPVKLEPKWSSPSDTQKTKHGVVVKVGTVDRQEHLNTLASWLEGEGWPRHSENLAMFHRSYWQHFHGVFKEDGTLASKGVLQSVGNS